MGTYTVKDTKSGSKTLLYKKDKEIRLHSAYDPEKEAERAVSGFEKGRCSFIIISGLALGYHLKYLKKEYPDTPHIIIEHDPEVVKLARTHYPDHLENSIIITPETDLGTVFENIDMSEFTGISHYIHKPSYLLYSQFYDAAIRNINQYISSKISDLLTRFEFEERWIENIFSNIHNISEAAAVKDFFGKFKGYPGIIISAGPSLRKNAHLLNEIKDRALLVSVDTAIKVLDKQGISPHIVMSLDAQKYSLKHFLGLKSSTPSLLADLVCYPPVLSNYKGNKILSTTSKYYTDMEGQVQRETTPVMDWIEQHTASVGDVQSGGSVATSVFDFLLNCGCDPIILVGQDLAYTGREIHCSGTYHNDDWLPITNRFKNLDTINQQVVRKRKIKRIEAFGGDTTVISDFVFDLYRGWFEDSAQKVPVTVINATEGGGRIANTKEETLSSLNKRLKSRNSTPEEILTKISGNTKKPSLENLAEAIDNTKIEIESIKEKSEKITDYSSEEAEKIIESIKKNSISKIYNPLLRKTRVYLTRKELPKEQSQEILIKEIGAISERLLPLFDSARERLG